MKSMSRIRELNRAGLPMGLLAGVCLATFVPALMGQGRDSESAKAAARARGSQIKINAAVKAPEIIAVRVRHDMCPFCKGFDPQFPELVRSIKGDGVLFVTLDLSSETTQQQAAMLLGALGLEDLWTGDMSLMGTITFVNGKTSKVISTEYQVDQETVLSALRTAQGALP